MTVVIGLISMNEEKMDEISKNLEILVKLSAANTIKDHSFKEQVRILSLVGFKPREIAKLVGKSANNVRVTLALLKKEGRR